MTLHGLYLIAASAALTASANLFLRGGVLRFGGLSLAPDQIKDGLLGLGMQPLFVIGVILYALAAIVWFSAISIEDLSVSYPTLVGLTFILVALGATLFFQESITLQRLSGMGLILTGIWLVARA